MKVSLWLTTSNKVTFSADMTSIDENFKWETEHIPLVGDNVTINLEHLSHLKWADDIGWIDGKVVERKFTASTNEVELTLEIENTVGVTLSNRAI